MYIIMVCVLCLCVCPVLLTQMFSFNFRANVSLVEPVSHVVYMYTCTIGIYMK